MKIVDAASTEEVLKMVEMGVLVHLESTHYRQVNLDGEKVYNYVKYLIASDTGVVLLAKTDDDVIIGGFIGDVQEHWMSTDRYMNDLLLYVHPDYRKGRTALRLVQEALKRAELAGVKEVVFSPSSGELAVKAGRLYEHCGFTKVGSIYSKFI